MQIWKMREPASEVSENSIAKFADRCTTKITQSLLKNRSEIEYTIPQADTGISSVKNREYYQPAIDLIVSHLEKNLPILIYGDSDVDGITATVSLETLLIAACKNEDRIFSIIPDRIARGYGMKQEDIIEYTGAIDSDPTHWLIVTVDCGTNDVEPVKILKDIGYNVLITDHHLSEGGMPEEVIICNPKVTMPEDNEEYGQSGCYVAAKVGFGVLERLCLSMRSIVRLVDPLVALSILSDQIVITDLSRKQFVLGINILQSSTPEQFPGLFALLDESYWQPGSPITSTLLGFSIIPKLNSAGRCNQPQIAYQLLSNRQSLHFTHPVPDMKSVYEEKLKLVMALKNLNSSRKIYESQLIDTFVSIIETSKQKNSDEYKDCIILHKEDGKLGVLGIVAARLMEAYKVPVLILATDNEEMKGSGRAPDGYDLYALLKACDTLTNSGGHKVAAGLSLKPEKYEDFKKQFKEKLKEHPKVDVELLIDYEAKIHELYDSRVPMTTSMLEPFGNGNPNPTFLLRQVKCIGSWDRGESAYIILVDEETNCSIVANKFRPMFNRTRLIGRLMDIVVQQSHMFFGNLDCTEYKIVDMHVVEDKLKDAQDDFKESVANEINGKK